MIYKILTREEWSAAQSANEFAGSAVDLNDGYIHFSTAQQVAETAAKHFAGLQDLVLLGVDEHQFADELKWEPSRGGDLFPHLYGSLSVNKVLTIDQLKLDSNGTHLLPDRVTN